jgi:hypothetical protein
MFPETAGKSLEEITAIFEDPHGIKYVGKPAWKTKNTYRHIAKAERGDMSDVEVGRGSFGDKDAKVSEERSPERHVVTEEKGV